MRIEGCHEKAVMGWLAGELDICRGYKYRYS